MITSPNGWLAGLICLLSIGLTQSPAETIFSDDFESGALKDHWQEVNIRNSEAGGIESRPQYVHSGKASLRLTSLENNGQESGSQVIRWFMPGYDQLYYRWYAMFAEDFDQGNLMHWTGFRGCRIDDRWSGFGRAGIKPDGTDRFSTGFEPWRDWGRYPAPGALNFYSYFPEMKPDRDGVHYWGNQYFPDSACVVERGRWYCFEVMLKVNKPGSHDGEQVFWVDGRKLLHVTGMRWRDTDMLKLNAFIFGVYVHQARRNNTCWYDDLVIGTRYNGPRTE